MYSQLARGSVAILAAMAQADAEQLDVIAARLGTPTAELRAVCHVARTTRAAWGEPGAKRARVG